MDASLRWHDWAGRMTIPSKKGPRGPLSAGSDARPLNLVAQRTLDRALNFLAGAFGALGLALGGQVGAVGGVAGDLFDFSGGLVGGALGLVGHLTHWSAPWDRT